MHGNPRKLCQSFSSYRYDGQWKSKTFWLPAPTDGTEPGTYPSATPYDSGAAYLTPTEAAADPYYTATEADGPLSIIENDASNGGQAGASDGAPGGAGSLPGGSLASSGSSGQGGGTGGLGGVGQPGATGGTGNGQLDSTTSASSNGSLDAGASSSTG
jgi:hypothetical protein